MTPTCVYCPDHRWRRAVCKTHYRYLRRIGSLKDEGFDFQALPHIIKEALRRKMCGVLRDA